MKFLNTFCVSFLVFVLGVVAFDFNKQFTPCLEAGKPGFSISGIVSLAPGPYGGFSVSGSKSKCPAIYCKCGITGSGTIMPPRLTKFGCIDEHGCYYEGANVFGLQMRRLANKPGCVAESILEENC